MNYADFGLLSFTFIFLLVFIFIGLPVLAGLISTTWHHSKKRIEGEK